MNHDVGGSQPGLNGGGRGAGRTGVEGVACCTGGGRGADIADSWRISVEDCCGLFVSGRIYIYIRKGFKLLKSNN